MVNSSQKLNAVHDRERENALHAPTQDHKGIFSDLSARLLTLHIIVNLSSEPIKGTERDLSQPLAAQCGNC